MKNTFPIIISICLVLISPKVVEAQQYNNGPEQGYSAGIGVRAGATGGLTFKGMIGERTAIEGIAGWGFQSFRITGLYEIHANAFDVPRLNWFYGLGAHVAFYNYRNCNVRWNGWKWEKDKTADCNPRAFGIGIDGIIGIEYQVSEIPFTFSLDIKPALELHSLGYFPFLFWDGALSIRYVW